MMKKNFDHLYVKNIYDKIIYYNPYNHSIAVDRSSSSFSEELISVIENTPLKDDGVSILDNAKQTLMDAKDVHQLYMILTTNCNYACKYCRQRQEKSDTGSNTMSPKVAFDVVDKFLNAHSSRRKGIVFYGGEPLLESNLLEDIVKYVRSISSEIELNVFTNGSLVSERLAKLFADNDVFIIVSYDGLAECNDKLRITATNQPTSAKTLEGFNIYKKSGCKVGFSMTIGAHNIDNLQESIDYLRSLSPENIGFNLPHDDEENPLRAGVNADFVNTSIRLFWKACEDGLYTEHIVRKVIVVANNEFKFVECPAACGRIVVMPNGNLGFCEGAIGYDGFFSDEKIWDTLETSRNIWKKSLPIFDDRCTHCKAIGICGGGCLLDGYFENDKLSNYNSIRCKFSKAIIDVILEKIVDNIAVDKFPYLVTQNDKNKLLSSLTPRGMTKKPLETSAKIGSCKYSEISEKLLH